MSNANSSYINYKGSIRIRPFLRFLDVLESQWQIGCFKGAGGGSPTFGWPKNVFTAIFVEGKQGYQILFTGSKNIDPSPSYRVLKIAKYIQLGTLRPRALLAIISKSLILTLENVKLLLQFLSQRLPTWQLFGAYDSKQLCGFRFLNQVLNFKLC